MTQPQTVTIQNLIILPLAKVHYKDEWSYEFSIYNNDGIVIDVDGQQYDTYRIFSDGTIRGTLSEGYYVYDEVDINVHPDTPTYVNTERLYKYIHEICYSMFEDHTEYALAEFAEDEDEDDE